MKKMVCEICGSQKIRKENEFFSCLECGTEYSLEEAKKLLKDIDSIEEPKKEINNISLKKVQINPNHELILYLSIWAKITSFLENLNQILKFDLLNEKFWEPETCLENVESLLEDVYVDKLLFGNELFSSFEEAGYEASDLIIKDISLIVEKLKEGIRNCESKVKYNPNDVFSKNFLTIFKNAFTETEKYKNDVNFIISRNFIYNEIKRLFEDKIFFDKIKILTTDKVFNRTTCGGDWTLINSRSELCPEEYFDFQNPSIYSYYSFIRKFSLNPLLNGYQPTLISKKFFGSTSTPLIPNFDFNNFKISIINEFNNIKDKWEKIFKKLSIETVNEIKAEILNIINYSRSLSEFFNLPLKYRNSKALLGIITLLYDGRALNWENAVNLYETEVYRKAVLVGFNELNIKLSNIENNLLSINNHLYEINQNLHVLNINFNLMQSTLQRISNNISKIKDISFWNYWNSI